MLNHLERINLLRSDVPEEFLLDVVDALKTLYRESYDETCQLPGDYQRYLRPHLLRTKAEIAFLTLARRHGLMTDVQHNRSRDAHARILTDNFVITLSRTFEPNQPPRWARFRINYARLGQYWLPFPMFANEPSPIAIRDNDPRMFVVIAHGQPVIKVISISRELGFVYANFVADGSRSYTGEGIDLVAMVPVGTLGRDVEVVQEPTLAAQVDERSEDGGV